MGDPPEIRHLPGKNFSAPYRTVITIANAIDRNADAGFGRGRCDVCPVVLDRDQFEPVFRCDLARKPGREKPGVKVMGNHIKLSPKKPLQVPYRFLKVFKGRRVPDISHVG
jgi:hypothetical protein